MLGFIFFELKQYVVIKYGNSAWQEISSQAHLSAQQNYKNQEAYSDKEFTALLFALAEKTQHSVSAVEEDFGVFVAPFLIRISKHMMPASWTFLDLLLHTQDVIHERLKKSLAASTTPFLTIKQNTLSQVEIVYQSPRHMCHFAKGLLKGLSQAFQTSILIEEPFCMHRGEVSCLLRVSILDSSKNPKTLAEIVTVSKDK